MIQIRKAEARGHFDFGWLDTRHTFSFGDYYDPRFNGFRVLRVINEDRVAPGQGFGTHPHRDMEIVSWVLEGALEHQDSTGSGGVLRPGDAQRMSAGSGVLHSEYNASKTEAVHFLQLWIVPSAPGLQPGYQQKHFPASERWGRLRPLVSMDGREGSLTLNQDVVLYDGLLKAGDQVEHALAAGRHGWVQVAKGEVEVNGASLAAGDGAAVSDERTLLLRAGQDAEVLVFDLC